MEKIKNKAMKMRMMFATLCLVLGMMAPMIANAQKAEELQNSYNYKRALEIIDNNGDENEALAVESIDNGQLEIDNVYDMNGRKLSQMQRGINIIRMKDGSTRKVLRK